MKKKISSFLLVFLLTLGIFSNVNIQNAHAEVIGTTKVVYAWVSKASIVSEIGTLNTAPYFVDIFAAYLSKKTSSPIIAAGITAVRGATTAIITQRRAELTALLQDIINRGAAGVLVKDYFTYMYMNGSGTGWYLTNVSFNLYW